MTSRRAFLKTAGAACGGCLGLDRLAPRWWHQVAAAAESANTPRRLVVIELQGGNDGLNTVVPFADDAYYRARPTLAIKAGEVIKLDDHLGLHPAMKSWRPLWDAGRLAIVENCGYPNPNRSHFESMAIWHAGQPESSTTSGWLGRASDADAGELCYVGQGSVPHALSGRRHAVAALARLADLRLRDDAAQTPSTPPAAPLDLSSAIAARIQQARDLSSRLAPQPDDPSAETFSNDRPLAQHLGVVRSLIEQDQPFRVFYTALDGFDTHAAQRNTHESLWEQTSGAVSAFLDELRKRKLSENVAVFLFSEFGRRLKENGSQGTDHGAAAPVMLLGDKVRGGLSGGLPDLVNLDDGDVRHQVDFRDVYASLLGDWLGVDPTAILGAREKALKLFS